MPPDWDVLVGFDRNPPTIWNASEGTPGYNGQLIVTWMTGGKAQALVIGESDACFTKIFEGAGLRRFQFCSFHGSSW